MEFARLRDQLFGEAPVEASAAQAAPAADEQSLFGNSFLSGIFGGEEMQPLSEGVAAAAAEAAATIEDRRQAAEELRGKFDLENPVGVDGRAAVSPEEFEEIVAMYSDIRRGRTNLGIDTAGLDPKTAEAFKSGAMDDIGTILQTDSGRRLIRDLAYNEEGTQTTIKRQPAYDTRGPITEAWVDRDDCTESFKKDRLGDQMDWCIDDRAHDGSGVHSNILYRPGETTVLEADKVDSRSDVTLYHELAHALHNMRGDQARGAVRSASGNGTVDNDEFQATGLGRWAYLSDEWGEAVPTENLYRSERRDLGEDIEDRRSYDGTSPAS